MCKYLLFVTLAISVGAHAAETSTMRQIEVNNVDKVDQVGVGIQAGTTTGINVEYWLSQNTALAAALAPEHRNGVVTLGANYMFKDTFTGNLRSVTPYVGGGALVVFGSNNDYLDRTLNTTDFAIAAQVPLGLAWLPPAQRFDIFAQISPSMEVGPVLMGFMAADLGAHFYF